MVMVKLICKYWWTVTFSFIGRIIINLLPYLLEYPLKFTLSEFYKGWGAQINPLQILIPSKSVGYSLISVINICNGNNN